MNTIFEIIKEYCEQRKISRKGVILHGSQALGFANINSDYDILIITDDNIKSKIDVFITLDNRRIQIEFISFQKLREELENYESFLFKQILDLNLIAGRILMGIILEADDEIKTMIENKKSFRLKKELINRFLYMATNFLNDSKTNDFILKNFSLQVMAISIGNAILIKNDIFWLSIKWQHRFLKDILTEEDFALYVRLRFNEKKDDKALLIEMAKKLIKNYI